MLSNDKVLRSKPVKFVIFDLDGTILDTESILHEVMIEILQKYEIQPDNELIEKFTGRLPSDIYNILKKERNLQISFEQFRKERKELEEKYFRHHVQLMPGASELIRKFYENKILFAIATNSTKEDVAARTVNYKELFSKFHHITTSDQVKRGKPYPDIYLLCASEFPESPEPVEILVFEDSWTGTESALAAGMQVILVVDGSVPDKFRSKVIKIIRSLPEFDATEFFPNIPKL